MPVLLRLREPAPSIFLILLTVAVLFMRRPDQFWHPYIWVEDGYYTLRFSLEDGWRTIFAPLAGYLCVASKLIGYAAYRISILWAPEIELALTVAFTSAVVAAVAYSPTHLRWPFLCAVAVLFVPTDSEVFAVSAYAFWWAGLLMFLALLWDTARGREWLRWSFIVFGGLSSPLAVTLLPLFLLRAIVDRGWSEYVASALAIAVAVAQVLAMHQQNMPVSIESISLTLLPISLKQFVGKFVYNGDSVSLAIGVVFAALALGAAWLNRAHLDRYFLLLLAAYCVVCVSVAVRMPITSLAGIDPFIGAPRYFFYPFTLLAWLLVWLAASSSGPVRAAVAAVFACSVAFSWHGLTRHHDKFDWRQNILACAAQSGEYELPVHLTGKTIDLWYPKYTGDECRALLRRSLF